MAGAICTAGTWEWQSAFAGVRDVFGWRNVVGVAWLKRPTAGAVHELGTMTEQLLAALGGSAKLSYIHFVPVGLGLPDSDARSALHEITRNHGQSTACVGVVLNGSGFWASAVRSIVTSVQVIAPASTELRVHADANELFEWFPREHERLTGIGIQQVDLRRMVDQAVSRQQASVVAHSPTP